MKELLLHNEYVELIICFYNVKLLLNKFHLIPCLHIVLFWWKKKRTPNFSWVRMV